MQLRSTSSSQRTYRYVRIAIVGVVVFLLVGVTAQIVTGGVLTSVSASYYTSARSVFVGGLCAVALALLALSGRSVEQILLDLAAVLAPVIAFVPARIEVGDVPGLDPECATPAPCVPDVVMPDVEIGIFALATVGTLGVATALILAIVQRVLTRAVVAGLLVAGIVVLTGTLWWALAPASFVRTAHDAATIGFFALVAAVAALAALRPQAGSARAHRMLRTTYAGIAIGIGLALAGTALVVVLRVRGVDLVDATGLPLILIGEGLALLLFAVFWVVQTIEKWSETDPRAMPGIGRE